MKATPEQISAAADRERAYQDQKWGSIEQHPHTVGEWILVLQGELDEAILAWQKKGGDVEALREILQVYSVARACMEQHGVVERPVNQCASIPDAAVPLLTPCEPPGYDWIKKVFLRGWNELAKDTHQTHKEKGFARVTKWTPEAMIAQIALMHEELSEAVHGIRKDLNDDKLPRRKMIEVELADVVIRIMNFATETGLDVAGAIIEKNLYNRTREHRHGDKAL